MLNAGDGERKSMVMGENRRREDDMMRISAAEQCVRTTLCWEEMKGAM